MPCRRAHCRVSSNRPRRITVRMMIESVQKIFMAVRIVRFKFYRPAARLDRFIKPSLLGQRKPQIVMCFGKVRLEPNDLAK